MLAVERQRNLDAKVFGAMHSGREVADQGAEPHRTMRSHKGELYGRGRVA